MIYLLILCPAKIKLDTTTWVYWTNRFGTLAVDFGADGLVSVVRD